MPRPKTGTIVIKQEVGKPVAYVRNQGGQEFLAEGLGNTLKDKNGQTCTFAAKKGKIQQLAVGGKTYTPQEEKEAPAKKSKGISAGEARQQMREQERESQPLSGNDIVERGPCQKKVPMQGTNLFDGNKQALRLPKDTAEQVSDLFKRKKGSNKPEIENFALLLNKSAHFFDLNRQGKAEYDYSSGKSQPFIFRQTFDDRSGNQKDDRGRPRKVKRKFEIEFDFPPDLIDHANKRQASLRASWQSAGWQISSSTFTPDFRLVMGLGTASVFETSLTLHHVYGIPYLPASSIKGVTRSWVIINYFLPDYLGKDKANEKAEKAAMRDPLFAYLFGSDTNGPENKAHRGHIMFFDAFPQSPPVIEPDIMNVHYPDWYSSGKAPTDTQSPNPIPFLTVGKCDAFQKSLQVRFDLACKEKRSIGEILKEKTSKLLDASDARMPLDLVHGYLKSALTAHGLGAKTALGYGFFQSPQT